MSRNEPPGALAASYNQAWHGQGPNPGNATLPQPDSVMYSQHQAQQVEHCLSRLRRRLCALLSLSFIFICFQVSSNAVKDPTKTKIQECINKKRLEAARISGESSHLFILADFTYFS